MCYRVLDPRAGNVNVILQSAFSLPIGPKVVLFLVNQNLYYRILTIRLVSQKKNYNGDYR